MRYVYGCPDKAHPRKEVSHGMSEDPVILCACGKPMHRIPQPFLWGWNAGQHLAVKMSDHYAKLRGNYAKNKARA